MYAYSSLYGWDRAASPQQGPEEGNSVHYDYATALGYLTTYRATVM